MVVTSCRRYSSDLVQEGVETPCYLGFCGEQKYISKVKESVQVEKTPNNHIEPIGPCVNQLNTLNNIANLLHHAVYLITVAIFRTCKDICH